VSKRRSLTRSFGFAFSGIGDAFKNEPNFRIHTTAAVIVLVAAALLGFNPLEWLVLLLTIYLVIAFELLNTVLEKIVDLASPKVSETARMAKDISAAAVLTSAILSIVVGIVLFLPKILSL
jgi:undecaprenol kinase